MQRARNANSKIFPPFFGVVGWAKEMLRLERAVNNTEKKTNLPPSTRTQTFFFSHGVVHRRVFKTGDSPLRNNRTFGQNEKAYIIRVSLGAFPQGGRGNISSKGEGGEGWKFAAVNTSSSSGRMHSQLKIECTKNLKLIKTAPLIERPSLFPASPSQNQRRRRRRRGRFFKKRSASNASSSLLPPPSRN